MIQEPDQKNTETARIRSYYEQRIEQKLFDRYSLFHPGELYMLQHREEDILKLLRKAGLNDLRQSRILEVGCGRGIRLVDWMRWGAQQKNLHGIDIMEPFIQEAEAYLPLADLKVGGGDNLPHADNSFDFVVQQTVFTSIKDPELRQSIANEMLRVVRPGGHILWYDFRYPNPRNREVRPVGRSEIGKLFPGCRTTVHSVTLAPPIARHLARASFTLCRLLETIPPLRTHYLALLTPPAS